jgi:acyl carrier protein
VSSGLPSTARALRTHIETLIAEVLDLDPAQMTGDARLRDDFGLDSLDLIDLAMAVETRLGIEISDRQLEALVTLGDAIQYVTAALSPPGAPAPA